MSGTGLDLAVLKDYFSGLQTCIVGELEALDGRPFRRDEWVRHGEQPGPSGQSSSSMPNRPADEMASGSDLGGSGMVCLIEEGDLFERGGVNFSHVRGRSLPPAASARRSHLTGRRFEAMGVSLVLHPRNPYCPTAHMNVRALVVLPAKDDPDGHEAPVWWFGGGTDLTPYYPFVEDVRHFHRVCRDAVQPFGDALYPQLKAACDHYFYLPHRREARGVGGIFFDDLNNLDSLSGSRGTANADSRGAGYGDCAACFALVRAVGDAFTRAYLPILEKRRDLPYGERERDFQAYRRGRYVEFNLVCDRGTLFGLQSGGRTESILMSLPPVVKWRYDWQPEPGSDEARLYEMFLPPRDWL